MKKINERKNEMTGNVQFELFLGVYYKKWRTTGSIYTKERWNNNGDLGVKTAEKRNPKSWGKPVSYFNLGGGGGESFDFFPLHSKSFQIKFSISQWFFFVAGAALWVSLLIMESEVTCFFYSSDRDRIVWIMNISCILTSERHSQHWVTDKNKTGLTLGKDNTKIERSIQPFSHDR